MLGENGAWFVELAVEKVRDAEATHQDGRELRSSGGPDKDVGGPRIPAELVADGHERARCPGPAERAATPENQSAPCHPFSIQIPTGFEDYQSLSTGSRS